MSLPKMNVPVFSTKLLSNNKHVKYKLYTVREEKILLMASESNDYQTILDAIKQVVNNCVVEDEFDIDKIPQFDIEYLFLKIRASSNSNVINLVFQNTKCPQTEGGVCRDKIKIQIDLETIGAEQYDPSTDEFKPYKANEYRYGEHGKQIMLDDKIGIVMRFPTIDDLKLLREDKTDVENQEALTLACIVNIFDETTVYKRGVEFSDQEIIDFYADLTIEAKEKIDEFMGRVPVMKKTIPYKCTRCQYSEDITLVGLRDFLA